MELLNKLRELFGFDRFKGNQEAIINSVLEGNDTFVIMPTGSGKSLCYQLPAMISEGTAIVVSPLIALMKNQVDAVRYTSGRDGVAHFLNSSLNKQQTLEVRGDVLSGGTKLLYVAPETLSKEDTIELLRQVHISFFAIDEAHCISEWGHDFRPEYGRLRVAINQVSESMGRHIPVLALTASATPKVQQDIIKNLEMEDANKFISSFNRPNLYYEVRPKPKDSVALLREIVRFIKDNEGKSGIIYCLKRKQVEDLAELLQVNGIKALAYHAGMDSKTRTENQDKFLMEQVDVIVATIAFGMGIDKPDVRYVIHYDIPKSLEGYYQETGRAGRDGGEGHCIAFYGEKDVERLHKFFADKSNSEQEIANQLVQEITSYAESTECRRRMLLKYFGEDYPDENCGNCDNCVHPKPQIEATQEMVYAIETILATKQAFKADKVIDVMMGRINQLSKVYKHDKLEQFGQGADHDDAFWKAVLQHGVLLNLLSKDVEQYGVLKITTAGFKFMKTPYEVRVAYQSPDDDEGSDECAPACGGGAADEMLYAQLKSLLRSIAKKENVPTHVILDDRSLADMTVQYPCTIEELGRCMGVGMARAKRYGTPFVELIKSYVDENEIERPILVRSVVSKTNVKMYIIENIDKQKSLDDIAEGKGMTMDDLLTELERIVDGGIKLNLDYYIEANIEEEHQEELMAYWQESESTSLDEAYEEFADDPDYTQAEIRIMRLKFLLSYF